MMCDQDNITMYGSSLLPPQAHRSTNSRGQDDSRSQLGGKASPNLSHGITDGPFYSSPNDAKDTETVEALLFSLQSSRNEVDSLKKSLLLCQQSLDFHKTEHESLVGTKDKENSGGKTLKAKDRDRLKRALQELKDYEVRQWLCFCCYFVAVCDELCFQVYREVMEAAMSRMQNEIDKLEADNIHLKQHTTHLEKELRKSKNITNKITRETSDFEKSKAALHDRVSAAEKEARRLGRERDAAVLALSQYKAEKARDEEDLKSSRRVKHKEVLEVMCVRSSSTTNCMREIFNNSHIIYSDMCR